MVNNIRLELFHAAQKFDARLRIDLEFIKVRLQEFMEVLVSQGRLTSINIFSSKATALNIVD